MRARIRTYWSCWACRARSMVEFTSQQLCVRVRVHDGECGILSLWVCDAAQGWACAVYLNVPTE